MNQSETGVSNIGPAWSADDLNGIFNRCGADR